MTPPLLIASKLAKSFPQQGGGVAVGDMVRLLLGRDVAASAVLSDIDLTVRRRQSLGVIGENGAGKSTLLKLLTGVLQPTAGRVERTGTIGALLELGAGFDKELSGRQNIGLAAGLLGWSRAEVERRSDEIVSFADIGRYIDEPVKHYSSGMVVRLGFAIVAAVKPDLLITDEVLAVGDESFQKKCIRWIEGYLAGGGTLMLVSHSMYHVQKLCRQALWLKEGRVEAYGDVFEVTQAYLAYHERKSALESGPELDPAYGGAEYRITRVSVNDSEDVGPVAAGDEPLRVEATIYSPDDRCPQLALGIARADGTAVYATTTDMQSAAAERIDDRHWRYRCRFEPLPLLPGSYTVNLHAMDPEGVRLFDAVERALVVRGATRELGLVRLAHRWD